LTGHSGQARFEFPLALFEIALILVFSSSGLLGIDRVIGKAKL